MRVKDITSKERGFYTCFIIKLIDSIGNELEVRVEEAIEMLTNGLIDITDSIGIAKIFECYDLLKIEEALAYSE